MFSSLIKIVHPLEGEELISQVPFVVNNLLFYKCVCTPAHTCTHTHTELHFQEITVSLKEMSYFQFVLHAHVEHFLRQRHASGCVGLELREIMETKSSAHELQEKPWPQIRS